MKETFNYLIFGILTTLINIICYYLLGLTNPYIYLNNIIAWIISVIFAYVTNALFVFGKNKLNIKDFIKFVNSRLSTLIIEMILLAILLNLLNINSLVVKIIVNIIVIILNYFLSKFLVFK